MILTGPAMDSFLGNEQAKQTLIGMTNDGRLSHALLLTGEAGCGKRTFAKLCAAALLCESPGQKPCGTCAHCRKALSGIHPDVIFTDCADVSGQFPVERLRELLSGVYVAPNEAARKVYVLANCHNLSAAGPHALLKTLEEPPETAAFVLTCHARSQLLPTVLSRVVEIPLRPLEETQVLALLRRRFPDGEPGRLARAAELSFGSVGEALALLGDSPDQETRTGELYGKALACAAALAAEDEYDTLLALSAFERDKEQMTRLLELLLRSAREAMDAGLRGRAPKGEIARSLGALEPARLAGLCQALMDARDAQRQNANRSLLPAHLTAVLFREADKESEL